MVAAIAGGAFVPLAASAVLDLSNHVIYSFLVPLVCLIYLFIVAILKMKKKSD